MPALASPVADECSGLRGYLSYHRRAFFAVAYGVHPWTSRADS